MTDAEEYPAAQTMTERERIVRTLRGQPTDLVPWTTRLDIWHTSQQRRGILPVGLQEMDLMEIHRRLGLGRFRFVYPTRWRLRGVDLQVVFNGATRLRQTDPFVYFPAPLEYAVRDEPGETVMHFSTPVGSVRVGYAINAELVEGAADPYLVEHVIKDDNDYRVVQWILQHMEIEPYPDEYARWDALIGADGMISARLGRVPFQELMLDYYGEERAIFTMMDKPEQFRWMLDILSELRREVLEVSLATSALIFELVDNIDGMITSPRLFQRYCMPFLQEVADKLHRRGLFFASHMDGNLKPLLHLIPDSGVDIIESFSPSPLSELSFATAWEAWQGKVLMWGAIPSPIFESHVPEEEFQATISDMLERIGRGRIFLGIGDQAMGSSMLERIAYVSERLGRTVRL